MSSRYREESVMLPHGIAYPDQLAILTKALTDYCHQAHIEPGTQEYHHAGHMVWRLFESGVETREELEHGLRLNRFPHPLDQVVLASRFRP
jgi:hypothetical protein